MNGPGSRNPVCGIFFLNLIYSKVVVDLDKRAFWYDHPHVAAQGYIYPRLRHWYIHARGNFDTIDSDIIGACDNLKGDILREQIGREGK